MEIDDGCNRLDENIKKHEFGRKAAKWEGNDVFC